MKSSNKILVVAVVLLLIANIALVAFMVMGKSKHEVKRGKGDPSEAMYKALDMTENQKKQHKLLKDEHFKNIRPLFDSVRAAKAAFYALVKDSSVSDSTINVYSSRISERQSAIDKLTFAHFKKLRSLFTAEQQPKFDSFLLKMMQRGRRDSTAKSNQ